VLLYLDHGDNAALFAPEAREIRGWTVRRGRKIWFVARFDQGFSDFGNWQSKIVNSGELSEAGVSGAYVTFSPGATVLMKIAISYVSLENAEANLLVESPDWDFGKLQAKAEAQWREKLSAIEIEGGSDSERRLFYTSLYHSLLHPNVFSDVNGEYLGFDGHTYFARGYTHYANFSGWDIYRSWAPLVAWLYPGAMSDLMQSLVADAREGGGAMPRWPVANIETGVMEGGSATPIVAQAYSFGARQFDLSAAFESMDRTEGTPGARCQKTEERPGLQDYLDEGYYPLASAPRAANQSVSMTLEFGTGEFALSQLARALGRTDRADSYRALSRSWKNLFDPETALLRPRDYGGVFLEQFDAGTGHMWGFTEGTAAQYLWMVPQGISELMALLGGNEAATAKLDHFFTKLNDGMDSEYSWIGNEPGMMTPWEYNWTSHPEKTQAVVGRMIDEVFLKATPGDDDLGATGSWAVWAMLGLYPALPGTPGLTLATPRFPLARVHLGDGRTLTINRTGAGVIRAVSASGAPILSPWIALSQLAGPAPEIHFELGDRSNWGQVPPPEF
ncbi:MAG: GH92 family glycosyl hydrolase, partial [Bdellovibrionota bacterium]